jgi:hypothetical protein
MRLKGRGDKVSTFFQLEDFGPYRFTACFQDWTLIAFSGRNLILSEKVHFLEVRRIELLPFLAANIQSQALRFWISSHFFYQLASSEQF